MNTHNTQVLLSNWNFSNDDETLEMIIQTCEKLNVSVEYFIHEFCGVDEKYF